jgi:sterol desaturase/sphingolipid hydroxylase (fatty acid hydroxylase superfamily)
MNVLILAFALAYLGMVLLCLTMNRHRGVLLRADACLPGATILRLLAAGCFGIALWQGIASQGGEIGTVVWFGLVMLSALLLVLLLAWRAHWVLPAVPVLALGGLLQGVS